MKFQHALICGMRAAQIFDQGMRFFCNGVYVWELTPADKIAR